MPRRGKCVVSASAFLPVDGLFDFGKVGCFSATSGHMAEHMRFDLVDPGDCRRFFADNRLRERYDLLSNQNAEQTDERDDGRRGGAHVEQAVNNADQQAGAK
ncbi:Hypothetical protein AT6N2_L0706 [Agrobacterium tumefaciens]|nr:Hypothetical protein AT6N2_L0706 [Agrobacterium tumefaciens]